MTEGKRRGVGTRRFVTLSEIAAELRVRASTLRESGVLQGCRHIPAGRLGKYELWLWEDVQQAVLSYAVGETRPSAVHRRRSLPSTSFVSLGDHR